MRNKVSLEGIANTWQRLWTPAYLVDNPKNKYGSHHYDLRRYGLQRDALHREYAASVDHFGIPPEAAR